MGIVEEVNSFYKETNKVDDVHEAWSNIVYIFVELGWTQKDIEEADLPFILTYLNKRAKVIKEQEKQSKKRR